MQPIGDGEQDDPLHFAPSLIEAIRQRPRQEIGTHTYSHYYCLEPGQTRDAFAADLASALAIAADRGVRIRSIIFPKNQDNTEYFDLLREVGITSYRSGEASWMYCVHNASHGSRGIERGGRKLDAYVNLSGMNVTPWGLVRQADGLCRIPSSRFLRPYSPRLRQFEPLRLRRIARGLPRPLRVRAYSTSGGTRTTSATTSTKTSLFSGRFWKSSPSAGNTEGCDRSTWEMSPMFSTAARPIVLMATDGPSSRIVYHTLAREFGNVEVILEERPSRLQMLRRRIKTLGPITVAGQVLFQATIPPLLKRVGARRIAAIKRDHGLDDSPIDVPVRQVGSANSVAARKALRELDPRVVVINGTRILSAATLKTTAAPFINLHAGITPLYRGVHGGDSARQRVVPNWSVARSISSIMGSTLAKSWHRRPSRSPTRTPS